jgi:hypothetical protein
VDHRAGLDDVEKRKFSPPYREKNSDLSVVQAVTNLYTDYTIPFPGECILLK